MSYYDLLLLELKLEVQKIIHKRYYDVVLSELKDMTYQLWHQFQVTNRDVVARDYIVSIVYQLRINFDYGHCCEWTPRWILQHLFVLKAGANIFVLKKKLQGK